MLEKLQACRTCKYAPKREWRYSLSQAPEYAWEHLADGKTLKIGYGARGAFGRLLQHSFGRAHQHFSASMARANSTLVKAITGELTPCRANPVPRSGTEIGYYFCAASPASDQSRMDETPTCGIWRLTPASRNRDFLGTYRFSAICRSCCADVGGEKARLCPSRLFAHSLKNPICWC